MVVMRLHILVGPCWCVYVALFGSRQCNIHTSTRTYQYMQPHHHHLITHWWRLRLKCDGTRAETRFRLSTKRTSPFKSAVASVQSTADRRAVHISLQGLYCSCKPVFYSHVTLTGYTPFSCFPFTSPPVHHRVPSHFKRSLPHSLF
jgi:hypothetical protein